MILIVLFLICYVVYLDAKFRYQKTDYYKSTKKPLMSLLDDKGCYGEYSIYMYLRKYEEDGAKFLFNCYLPKSDGQTTEVDVMMIHKSGIYVFESKNYNGWIFGSEYSRTWTQTLPTGRKAHKEHFLNPIMQNKIHIQWLKEQIGDKYPIYSIVVFSYHSELKEVEIKSSDIFVINSDNVLKTVKSVEEKSGETISQEEVESLYDKLFPFTQVTDEIKKKHIEDIKKEHIETDNDSSGSDSLENIPTICPRCGGKLILRNAERGAYAGSQFYGCSNFPKCRYIKNC